MNTREGGTKESAQVRHLVHKRSPLLGSDKKYAIFGAGVICRELRAVNQWFLILMVFRKVFRKKSK